MFRGERFEVDLGQDDGAGDASSQNTVLPGAFVNDILERKPAAPKAPTAPTLKSKTGFPEHGPRKPQSRFKQGLTSTEQPLSTHTAQVRSAQPASHDGISLDPAASGKPRTWEDEEKARIDRENNERLAEMSSAEIEQERRELMNSLSPEMIQKLLQRSSIESGSTETDLLKRNELVPGSKLKRKGKDEAVVEKRVAFAEPSPPVDSEAQQLLKDEGLDTGAENLHIEPLPADSSIHFPRPSQPPALDPSSATFLTDLHSKYFPSLPADPEKLEWMQSPSATSKPSKPSSYDPAATGIEPKDIRFSFKGALIPPSAAANIPVTAGLHHHGDAPDAAGYTIPELSHLARSSYPSQRCIAFQTLGRILYRLGKGEFGDASEPADVVGAETGLGALARGLWREVNAEKVTEMLVRESEGLGVDGGRHLSAKAYATEAVWLWQRGGGRRLEAE